MGLWPMAWKSLGHGSTSLGLGTDVHFSGGFDLANKTRRGHRCDGRYDFTEDHGVSENGESNLDLWEIKRTDE